MIAPFQDVYVIKLPTLIISYKKLTQVIFSQKKFAPLAYLADGSLFFRVGRKLLPHPNDCCMVLGRFSSRAMAAVAARQQRARYIWALDGLLPAFATLLSP